MVACLLIGFIMASAMLSTIPIYMNASLQRMLVKDLEDFQVQNNIYPGIYSYSASVPLDGDHEDRMEFIEEKLLYAQESFSELGVEPQNEKVVIIDDYDNIPSLTTSGGSKPSVKVGTMTNLDGHISFQFLPCHAIELQNLLRGDLTGKIYLCTLIHKGSLLSQLIYQIVPQIRPTNNHIPPLTARKIFSFSIESSRKFG